MGHRNYGRVLGLVVSSSISGRGLIWEYGLLDMLCQGIAIGIFATFQQSSSSALSDPI